MEGQLQSQPNPNLDPYPDPNPDRDPVTVTLALTLIPTPALALTRVQIMIPDKPMEIDLFTGGQIITYELRNMVNEGKIKLVKNSIDKFTPEGVDLARGDGSPKIECVHYCITLLHYCSIVCGQKHACAVLRCDSMFTIRSMFTHCRM